MTTAHPSIHSAGIHWKSPIINKLSFSSWTLTDIPAEVHISDGRPEPSITWPAYLINDLIRMKSLCSTCWSLACPTSLASNLGPALLHTPVAEMKERLSVSCGKHAP